MKNCGLPEPIITSDLKVCLLMVLLVLINLIRIGVVVKGSSRGQEILCLSIR